MNIKRLLIGGTVCLLLGGIAVYIFVAQTKIVLSPNAIQIRYLGTDQANRSTFWITNTTGRKLAVDLQGVEVRNGEQWVGCNSPSMYSPLFLPSYSTTTIALTLVPPFPAEHWRVLTVVGEELSGTERACLGISSCFDQLTSGGGRVSNPFSRNTTYYGHQRLIICSNEVVKTDK